MNLGVGPKLDVVLHSEGASSISIALTHLRVAVAYKYSDRT